jgi:prepilin-type N-terminal cleavage/methylation domain-containing protein
MMNTKHLKHNSRGDTIVEVMISIAIIGLVLAGGYVAANSSQATERQAQERSIATQITQGQIEGLRSYVQANPSFFTTAGQPTGNFCISGATIQYDSSSNGNCYFDSGGNANPGKIQPAYNVAISNDAANAGVSGSPTPWSQVQIAITWASVAGGQDNLTDYYRLQYANLGSLPTLNPIQVNP